MKKDNLDKLNNLLLFSKESLRQWEKNEDTLDFNIKYWSKKGLIVPLKKGLYLLKSRFAKETDKDLYLQYIANKMYEPSYVSSEYVMEKYNLLTEAVFATTSISTNKTKLIENELGRFKYYSITPKLFFGFKVVKFYTADVLVAEKTKAVFDYLYLRFLKKSMIADTAIEELRINWENLTKKEFSDIVKYAKLSNNKRINSVIKLIGKKYYA